MPGDEMIFRLLDALIEQTRLGNISWEPTESWKFVFQGSDARAVLSSVDRDGLYPVALSIESLSGTGVANDWVVERHSKGSEEAFDKKVRRLWQLVTTQHDAIASLLRELENLPPF
jgi:hypothetical protein